MTTIHYSYKMGPLMMDSEKEFYNFFSFYTVYMGAIDPWGMFGKIYVGNH